MSLSLLDDPALAGVYACSSAQWAAVADAARRRGIAVFEISPAGIAGLPELLRRMAGDLKFPTWFGNNLDALHDILVDADWHQGHPQMIHLANVDGACPVSGDDRDDLLDVLQSAVAIRREAGVPLWIVLGFDAPQIPEMQAP